MLQRFIGEFGLSQRGNLLKSWFYALGILSLVSLLSCSDSPVSSVESSNTQMIAVPSLTDTATSGVIIASHPNTIIPDVESKLKNYVNGLQSERQIQSISLYFRDLLEGDEFLINGNVLYSPASLMKVPVMMALLKYVESEPFALNAKIHFQFRRENNLLEKGDLPFNTETNLVPGHAYSIDELLEFMIVHSDNEATILLIEYLAQNDPARLNETQMELGLFVPTRAVNTQDILTVGTYANFFKVLYDQSYLSEPLSDKAVELLIRSSYSKGIRMGVPENIRIAQKFGFKQINQSQVQFHHFAIILHPDKPFLLGIMTRGENQDEALHNAVVDLARIAYDEVDKQTKTLRRRA